jgi:hypothetical protein
MTFAGRKSKRVIAGVVPGHYVSALGDKISNYRDMSLSGGNYKRRVSLRISFIYAFANILFDFGGIPDRR